ncbi:MAG: hypothetical protein ACHP83_22090 [Burkholderiales bacterium]
MSSRWPMACARAVLLVWGVAAGAASQAQTAGQSSDVASRESFRICDAKAFLALNIARNYLVTGRNRQSVLPYLNGDAAAEALADEVFRRVDAGEVRHPGQAAADVLFECAAQQKMTVGAPRQQVALCFTRTDIAFLLHVERSSGAVRQQAVSKVQARLKSREVYPTALINTVAEAVYAPPQIPDVRQLMGSVAWGCINRPPSAASAASG